MKVKLTSACIVFLFLFSLEGKTQLLPFNSLDTLKMFRSLESAMENPEAVYRLDLSKQKLTEVPVEIGKLKNLQELHLDKNKIELVPDFLAQLRYLQVFTAGQNKIDSIAPAFWTLRNLRRLDLHDNFVTEIPEAVENLKELRLLILWDNPINNYPNELGELSNLEHLDLLNNVMSFDTQERLLSLLPKCNIIMSVPCRCEDGQ